MLAKGAEPARTSRAPGVLEDFERILEHLNKHDVENAEQRIELIIDAINVLELNTLIARPVENNKHELVIGRRAKGYVALYRYVEPIDRVFVLAVRSPREAGYSNDETRVCIQATYPRTLKHSG